MGQHASPPPQPTTHAPQTNGQASTAQKSDYCERSQALRRRERDATLVRGDVKRAFMGV
ncbi:hypothetical protein E1A91_A08G182100v1 [Gossypium mustelinum]|uniref:Uncharacterized protein n=1 Tax=Gossypium mustelinum TaxID=34275 RepID=A0A5D2YA55_GOSMU|nr:hypothetical protein E1A91_A08G182100v1 [Gossypium mustelinum]